MNLIFENLNESIVKLRNEITYDLQYLTKRELTIISNALKLKDENPLDQMENEEIADLIIKITDNLEEYNG